MRVLAFEHVSVSCPADLEDEVVAWYRETLGLESMEKPEGTREAGAWFVIGAQQVHVTIDEHNPPKKAHFGLVVDDISVAVERLRNAGCHIEQASTIPGRHRFYTRDPAGNRIEIITIDEPAHVVASEGADAVGVRAEES